MSIVKESQYGYFISHKALIDSVYKKINYQLNADIFNIVAPYKKAKTRKTSVKEDSNLYDSLKEEVQYVRETYKVFYNELKEHFQLEHPDFEVRNKTALETASLIYDKSGRNLPTDLYGVNSDAPTTKHLNNETFLFPENSKFYSKDVHQLSDFIKDEKFDLIVLDPPWWNKYIRRKRKKSDHGYSMMYNEDLKQLPLENNLKDESLVVVWCTNSSQHLEALCNDIFPKWGLKFIAKWYWVKITKVGVPVCEFLQPPRKQPFEQIIFACKGDRTLKPPVKKLVVSIPSALHSHKPPLIKLLEPYLPGEPKCLELFARYLLPGWTSYGNEVLRFQNESLFEKMEFI